MGFPICKRYLVKRKMSKVSKNSIYCCKKKKDIL
jgi:hypothetical protein